MTDSRTKAILANTRPATPEEAYMFCQRKALVSLVEPVEFSTTEETKSGNGMNFLCESPESLTPSAEKAGWRCFERCYRPGYYEETAPRNRDFLIFWNPNA